MSGHLPSPGKVITFLQVITFLFFTLFTSAAAQDFHIYVLNTNTMTVSRLNTMADGSQFNAAFSPDGSRIAFDILSSLVPLGHSIFITKTATGETTQLTGGEGGNDAVYSPDGNTIAFDCMPVGDHSIYTVASAGGIKTLVKNDAVAPHWSPDGTRLVYQKSSDGSVRTMDLAGGNEILVAAAGSNPCWSPDGSSIIYYDQNNIWKVLVNNAGSPLSSPINLTNSNYEKGQATCSPLNEIAFSAKYTTGINDTISKFNIWKIAAGGNITRLAGNSDANIYDPAYSFNGVYIAMSSDQVPFVPVELSGFTAAAIQGHIVLNWQTSTEKNNRGFYVEKKLGGLFAAIGFIEGKGTSSEIQQYSFTDPDAVNGLNVYRLRQTDYDGTCSFSKEVSVQFSNCGEFILEQNYPNPFNPATTISYTLPEQSFVGLKVYDILGNEVAVLVSENQKEGHYKIPFNCGSLASGVYTYVLTAGKNTKTGKMQLLK